MRPSTAGVAVFSGLAAVVAADALPMDSIPIECVKVCGPIVELTDICNTNVDSRRRQLKRRKIDGDFGKMDAVRGQRLHFARHKMDACSGGRCKRDKVVDAKRQFSVIRQAPTSFPPAPETVIAQPAQPTRIFPVIVTTAPLPTAANPPPPPTDQTYANEEGDVDGDFDDDDGEEASSSSSSLAPSTTSSVGSATTVDAEAEATTTGLVVDAEEADGEDWWMPNDAEQYCVCSNDSFDVSRLTSLCASCVDQTGDHTNNINIIVSTCNFPNETYSRESDRLADGVRVRATKPTMEMSLEESAVVQKGASDHLRGQAAMLLAGVVTCAAFML